MRQEIVPSENCQETVRSVNCVV